MNIWFLVAALRVFGICVLEHEFGHFIPAKWGGVRVEEFGLGFPPRLVGFRKRDTGGWEVIWFGGRRNAEDSYSDHTQSPFSGTSGGVSNCFPGALAQEHTLFLVHFLPIRGVVADPREKPGIHQPWVQL